MPIRPEDLQQMQRPGQPAPAPMQPTAPMQQPMQGVQPDQNQATGIGRMMAQQQLAKGGGPAPAAIMDLKQQEGTDVATGSKMTKERLQKAANTLRKYKAGKASVEKRIISNQQWWKLRNWEEMEREKGVHGVHEAKGSTSWLWNSIIAKHADAMDSYPQADILPRQEDDKQQAKMLSDILPVALKINNFDEVYSAVMWQKYQEGTGCYGVFWDKNKLNGLGDISIQQINLLNLFWEPGVMDIQDSHNLFYVQLENKDDLEGMYPELQGHFKTGKSISVNKYIYDDNVDTSDKALCVDWYYHTNTNGKRALHFCKFVDDVCLFCSEDDPEMAEAGLYDDDQYPFVLDPLFPVQGSPCGYGYIDTCKDTQMDIDQISNALVLNTVANAVPRYFGRKDGGINEAEFSDLSKHIVHCSGNLGADAIMPINGNPFSGNALSMLQQKIDEIKFLTGNSDVNNGSTPSGVTAASALVALREQSGRSSKDSNRTSYMAFRRVIMMVIERIRQFYDMPRQFRITGQRGEEQFVSFDNSGIQPQPQDPAFGMDMGYRLPIFDIDVVAERENAYTKAANNELAMQLFQYGVFNPQQVDQSLMLLDMMDFDKKEELQQKVSQMGTMAQMLAAYQQIAMTLAQQYEPQLAQQMAQQINGQAANMAMLGNVGKGASTGQNESDPLGGTDNAGDTSYTRKARTSVNDATRVGK